MSAASAGSSAAIRSSVQRATSSPATPPSAREQHDSVSSCAISCQRARANRQRAPPSRRRGPRARASSRLAMLAQAISSTKPVTPSSSVSGALRFARDASSARARPARRHIAFALNAPSSASLMPFCSGASTSLTIAWYGTLSAVCACSIDDAGLQPREQVGPVAAPVVEAFEAGIHRPRIVIGTKTSRPDAERRAVEPARRDADDGHASGR